MAAGRWSVDQEDRVAGCHLQQLGIRRVRADAVEEHSDLELPPLQVSPQNVRLLIVGKLGRREALGAPADPELPAPGHPQVAHPLGMASRRYQVAVALAGQHVHWRLPPFAAGPAANVQYAASPDAD